jgi:hypothetical protein
VVVVLTGTLAIDFSQHAHAKNQLAWSMTTFPLGTLDTGPLFVERLLNFWSEAKTGSGLRDLISLSWLLNLQTNMTEAAKACEPRRFPSSFFCDSSFIKAHRIEDPQ